MSNYDKKHSDHNLSMNHDKSDTDITQLKRDESEL